MNAKKVENPTSGDDRKRKEKHRGQMSSASGFRDRRSGFEIVAMQRKPMPRILEISLNDTKGKIGQPPHPHTLGKKGDLMGSG